MSWQDRLTTGLSITTGDGKTYYPLWKDAKKNINYNTEPFEFIGVEGTFVERKEKSGTQFPLIFYFTGENCIEQTNAFELSARDKRPWKIKHPLYDDITAQPLSLEIDDSDYNVSKITCVVWETIDTKYPIQAKNISGEVLQLQEDTNTLVIDDISEKIVSIDTANVNNLNNSINTINDSYSTIASTEEEKQSLKDLFREASGAINNVYDDIIGYIEKVQALINFPFQTIQTIEFKIKKISDVLIALSDIFISDNATSDQDKELYNAHATAVVNTALSVASNPSDTDYKSRKSVITTINSVNELYAYYQSLFDNQMYDQNSDIANKIDYTVNITLGNLYDIAFNAKQERSIILNYDTNIIVLAHKYFGRGDDKLNEFIEYNNIQLDEYLQVRRGREIKYLQ